MVISTKYRRPSALLAALIGGSLALAGCGTENGGDPDDSDTSAGSEGYPVTVETANGPITLEEKPERIVAITSNGVDTLDALGLEPVAYTVDAYNDEQVVFERLPWLEELNTGEYDPTMVTAEYQAAPEAIAVHEPDLIIAGAYQLDESAHEQLSQAAPVYTSILTPEPNDVIDDLEAVGALTGETEAAEQATSDLDTRFTEAGKEISGLHGRTYHYAQWVGNGNLQFHERNWTLDKLGLVPGGSEHDDSGRPIQLSLENIEQLNAEVLMINAGDEGRAELEADPRFAELPAVKNGAVVWIDTAGHYGSMGTGGVYAGPTSITSTALPQILPQLEDSASSAGD